jgi:transposase
MIDLSQIENIYLVPGYTDMRKQVDGLLSVLTVNHSDIDLKSRNLYIFCSKDKTKLKVLEIDHDGIWVYYKRTHGDKYLWPKDPNHQIIEKRQLLWLLDGLNIRQKHAHKKRFFDY